jgi:transketolase
MPSWELFDHQPETYRREVLPPQARIRIAIEAGIPQGWHRYVGSNGEVVGLDHFGASAPFQTLYDKFGITAKTVVEKALALLG